MPRFVREEDKIAMWLLGVATGVFLMIIDELINLSLYWGSLSISDTVRRPTRNLGCLVSNLRPFDNYYDHDTIVSDYSIRNRW